MIRLEAVSARRSGVAGTGCIASFPIRSLCLLDARFRPVSPFDEIKNPGYAAG
jgi:hypothetical protein